MTLPASYTTGQTGHLQDHAQIASDVASNAAAIAVETAARTDATAALSGTYVAKASHTPNSLLIADASGNIVDVVVAASRVALRKATGTIVGGTTAELAALFGTPNGTKFLADDGTLKVPAGGGGGSGYVPSLEHNTSIGVPSIVDGSVVIDVTSKWGISGGAVYFDEDGATSGEEALMSFDATTGQLSWLLYSEVH